MKARLALLSAIPALVITVIGLVWYARGHHGHDSQVLRVSGNIEITDAEVSFKLPGRVERRYVDEGEVVQQGDAVAELDRSDLLSELAARQAELRAAQAALAELEAGSRPAEIAEAAAALDKAKALLTELQTGARPQEIAVAQATLARTQADLADAETNYTRVQDLYARQMAAQQEYDTALAAYDAAQARVVEALEQLKLVQEGPRQEEIAQARAAVAQAEQHFNLVHEGPRLETIEQARARVEQAKANVELSETRLGYTTLESPLAGVVLAKHIEPGEYVSPGTPVVTVGDLVNVWVRAYVNETDLGRVKFGQRARVTTDTYPGKVYDGRVSFIASQAEFTPKNVQTEKERVKLVFRIKIDIANPQMELKPGMPVDAEILLEGAE